MPSQLPARVFRPCRNSNVVGPAIIRYRHAFGWTQEELAGQLHRAGQSEITREVIANMESQRTKVPCVVILALARVFGIEAGDLFPYVGSGRARRQVPERDPFTAARRRRRPPLPITAFYP